MPRPCQTVGRGVVHKPSLPKAAARSSLVERDNSRSEVAAQAHSIMGAADQPRSRY